MLPRASNVHRLVTGGQDTVAVRVPSHPMAQQLLTAFGGGIAAPSANRYGHVSPTRAEHVREEFGDSVRVVLDGGECKVGLESTIVACLDGKVRLLRPGHVTLSAAAARGGRSAYVARGAEAPRVPGTLRAHYAPLTPLSSVPAGRARTGSRSELSLGGVRIARARATSAAGRFPLRHLDQCRHPAEAYAHDLYAHLRTLDKVGLRAHPGAGSARPMSAGMRCAIGCTRAAAASAAPRSPAMTLP